MTLNGQNAEKPRSAVIKFDTYRNLQWHHPVLLMHLARYKKGYLTCDDLLQKSSLL